MRTVIAVLCSAACFAGSLLLPAPAYAVVGCTGSACNGLDPGTEGCTSDAHLLQAFAGTYGEVKLYHSPTCDAAWAQEKNTSASTQTTIPSLELFYTAPLGGAEASHSKPIPFTAGQTVTTTMTNWSDSVKACDSLTGEDVDRFAPAEPTNADPDTETEPTDGAPQGICGEWF